MKVIAPTQTCSETCRKSVTPCGGIPAGVGGDEVQVRMLDGRFFMSLLRVKGASWSQPWLLASHADTITTQFVYEAGGAFGSAVRGRVPDCRCAVDRRSRSWLRALIRDAAAAGAAPRGDAMSGLEGGSSTPLASLARAMPGGFQGGRKTDGGLSGDGGSLCSVCSWRARRAVGDEGSDKGWGW